MPPQQPPQQSPVSPERQQEAEEFFMRRGGRRAAVEGGGDAERSGNRPFGTEQSLEVPNSCLTLISIRIAAATPSALATAPSAQRSPWRCGYSHFPCILLQIDGFSQVLKSLPAGTDGADEVVGNGHC